jgi:hypothetical protein
MLGRASVLLLQVGGGVEVVTDPDNHAELLSIHGNAITLTRLQFCTKQTIEAC